MAITQECCVQSWTSPGSNTPQDTNCTATCPLSRKLFKLDEPDMQDTAGEAEMYSYGSPHMAAQKQDDQHKRTFSSYVRLRDVVLKTYLGRWTIGRSGERGSGISVLPARYDDDDEVFKIKKDKMRFKKQINKVILFLVRLIAPYIYIYIYVCVCVCVCGG